MSTPLNRTIFHTLFFCLIYFLGACVMAEDIKLKWEWPLDREPQSKLIVSVDSLKDDKGFFGMKKSPSIDGYLPDPVILIGKVVSGEKSKIGNTIKITLPKVEVGSIKSGDLTAIGVYSDSICICIKVVTSVEEDLSDWVCGNTH